MKYNNIIVIICSLLSYTTMHSMFTKTNVHRFSNSQHIPLLIGRLYSHIHTLNSSNPPVTTTVTSKHLLHANDFLTKKINVKKNSIHFSNALHIQELVHGIYELHDMHSIHLCVIDPKHEKTVIAKKITKELTINQILNRFGQKIYNKLKCVTASHKFIKNSILDGI